MISATWRVGYLFVSPRADPNACITEWDCSGGAMGCGASTTRPPMTDDEAATKMQAVTRGSATRKQKAAEDDAATKMQV